MTQFEGALENLERFLGSLDGGFEVGWGCLMGFDYTCLGVV